MPSIADWGKLIFLSFTVFLIWVGLTIHFEYRGKIDEWKLFLAARDGNEKLVRKLIDEGIPANLESNEQTALDFAIVGNHPEIAKFLLLKLPEDVKHRVTSKALKTAARAFSVPFLELLLEAGGKPASNPRLLLLATSEGYPVFRLETDNSQKSRLETAGFLIEKGLISQDEKNQALRNCAKFGFDQIADLLLRNGAQVNSFESLDGNGPLLIAVKKKNVEVVRTLLKFRPDVSPERNQGKAVFEFLQKALKEVDSSEEIVKIGELLTDHLAQKIPKPNSSNRDLPQKPAEADRDGSPVASDSTMEGGDQK